jgi:TonB family protein
MVVGKKPIETPKKAGGKFEQGVAKEGEGARAKGREGTRGKPHAPQVAGVDPQNAAARKSAMGGVGRGGGASQVNQNANVDVLKGASSKIMNILGGSSALLGQGGKRLEGFGGFTTQGGGGLALSGDGRGGGGNADTLAGGLGNKGTGGGRVGTGLGAAGNGSGMIGGQTRVSIRTGGPEEAVVMGSIDADAVEAALLAHRDEFRYCYEKEINAESSGIGGRVGTTFVIGASGRVAQAGIESTSLKNANVERCVLNVIRRIDFPIPRGAGLVQVSYPFKFNSAKQ